MSTSLMSQFAQPINWSEPEYEAEGYFKSRTETDIFNDAVQVEDLLRMCAFGRILFDCSNVFHPVITDAGVCYTFNKDGKFSTKSTRPFENLNLLVNVNKDDMTWGLEDGSGIKVRVISYIYNVLLPFPFSQLGEAQTNDQAPHLSGV